MTRGRPNPLGGATAPPSVPRKRPLPSMLDGYAYDIRGNASPTDSAWVQLAQKDRPGRMQVPLGEDPASYRVRLHEMAHVRFTPIALASSDASPESLNACEDARIHVKLGEAGLDAHARTPLFGEREWSQLEQSLDLASDPYADGPMAEASRRQWTPLGSARLMAASIGTHEENRLARMLEDHGRGYVVSIVRGMHATHLGGRRPAWKRTAEYAQDLDATFSEIEDTLTDEDLENIGRTDPSHVGNGPTPPWGEMTIRRMPLVTRLSDAMRKRAKRATDTGAVPRYWHRLPVDQRVFGVNRKRPGGGTVLIDQSGSMHLDPDDVLALMAAYPAVTIATYAGSGPRGELRIIAAKGKRASDEDCHHPQGGNVVDGPALDWLARMPGPRVWVSDALCTGAHDTFHPGLIIDARRKCKAARIMQAQAFEDLLGKEDE